MENERKGRKDGDMENMGRTQKRAHERGNEEDAHLSDPLFSQQFIFFDKSHLVSAGRRETNNSCCAWGKRPFETQRGKMQSSFSISIANERGNVTEQHRLSRNGRLATRLPLVLWPDVARSLCLYGGRLSKPLMSYKLMSGCDTAEFGFENDMR